MKAGTFLRTRIAHLRNARRSRAEIEALQLRKFRRIVAHAQQHSPHYRDIIADRKIDVATAHPTDFPPLSKYEMSDEFDRIVTDPRISKAAIDHFFENSGNPSERLFGEYTVIHTTGTTGSISYSVFSQRAWAVGAALAMRVFPVTLGRRRMAFYGVGGGHYGGASHMSQSSRGLARLRFLTKVFDIREPPEKSVAELNQFQPETLAGYPSSLAFLAEAQLDGDLKISPRFVASGGEALTPRARELIDEAFAATILNAYGSCEHLTMGVGRPEDGGIYLFEDELIFEIEDDQVLVTNLFNFTQPLIRYAMDDRLEQIDDPAPTLPFTKIKDIGSRASAGAVLTDKDGVDRVLDPDDFSTVQVPVPNVSRIQLRVIDKTSCVLEVSLRKKLDPSERETALQEEQRTLDITFDQLGFGNVRRTVKEVERFEPGKERLIVAPESPTA